MNLKELSYQQQRLTLDAPGEKVRIYRAGRLPRYEIEAGIPTEEDQTVFNTRWKCEHNFAVAIRWTNRDVA